MSKKKQVHLLICDDEPSVRESLSSWFSEEGYAVETSVSGRDALDKLATNRWDVYLIDIKMPGMDGLELQKRIKEADPGATIILMTAFASVETPVAALNQAAYAYTVK